MSFAKKMKYRVKEAVKFIGNLEETAIKLAAEQKYDYVVCGHIHRPTMRVNDEFGHKVTYLNSGDWVENLTALEYHKKKWSIYRYNKSDFSHKDDIEESEELKIAELNNKELFQNMLAEFQN